jgi:hypothetical protein
VSRRQSDGFAGVVERALEHAQRGGIVERCNCKNELAAFGIRKSIELVDPPIGIAFAPGSKERVPYRCERYDENHENERNGEHGRSWPLGHRVERNGHCIECGIELRIVAMLQRIDELVAVGILEAV